MDEQREACLQEPKEVKEKKPKGKSFYLKIIALALCCSLLGGIVGGGAVFLAGNALAEKEYLESVLDAVSRATDPHDISDIRDELAEQGYIIRTNSKKKKQQKKSAPLEFISSEGYTILVGKNNKQNS